MNDREVQALRDAFAQEVGEAASDDVAKVDALVAGELEADEAAALAERAIDDPSLALEVRVAAAMLDARREVAATMDEASVTKAAPANSGTYRRALFSVAFAVAAALLVFVMVRPPSMSETGSSAVRAGSQDALRPSEALPASLPRDAFTLKWQGGPTEATYDLYVTTGDLATVYRAFEIAATQHTIDASALAKLPANTAVLWRVVATTPSGRRIHSAASEIVVQ